MGAVKEAMEGSRYRQMEAVAAQRDRLARAARLEPAALDRGSADARRDTANASVRLALESAGIEHAMWKGSEDSDGQGLLVVGVGGSRWREFMMDLGCVRGLTMGFLFGLHFDYICMFTNSCVRDFLLHH